MMNNCQHAAVWIDHVEAKLFAIDLDTPGAVMTHAAPHHVKHATRARDVEHPADDAHFYHEVVRGLAGAAEIVVLGPGTAKLELMKHVRKHDAALESKILGVENSDHPTEGEIVAFARTYFQAADARKAKAE